jgi:hypothetical protein
MRNQPLPEPASILNLSQLFAPSLPSTSLMLSLSLSLQAASPVA